MVTESGSCRVQVPQPILPKSLYFLDFPVEPAPVPAGDAHGIEVVRYDDTIRVADTNALTEEETLCVFNRTGEIKLIKVFINPQGLR